MAQDGEIDLNEVKARYSLKDITLVDSREVNFANETRLTFEISFAIGLTLLGSLINEYSQVLAITSGVFLLFGAIFLLRYALKIREIRIISPKSELSEEEQKNILDILG